MILVLCRDYQQVLLAFKTFVEFLEATDPWLIKQIHPDANRIDTDDDLHYIFMVDKYDHYYGTRTADRIYVDQFFLDLSEYYNDDYFEVIYSEFL